MTTPEWYFCGAVTILVAALLILLRRLDRRSQRLERKMTAGMQKVIEQAEATIAAQVATVRAVEALAAYIVAHADDQAEFQKVADRLAASTGAMSLAVKDILATVLPQPAPTDPAVEP